MSRAKFLPSITSVSVSDIEVPQGRLRPVSEEAIGAFIQSIGEHGLLMPLVVRRLPGPRYELVDGAHRLSALKELGDPRADVRCYEGPASAIRLIEIDANLARSDLSDLDRAIHMAARRREYLAEFPETAQGNAGAAGRWNASAETALASFVALTVARTGLPKRKVHKLVAAGEALDPVAAEAIRSAPRVASLNDLLAFARAEPFQRLDAAMAFGQGKVRTIAKALKQTSAAPAPGTVQQQELNALLKAWDRATLAVRRSFLAERFDDVSPLVVDEAARRDEAEIDTLRAALRRGIAAK